jgi:hypothetical protein
MAKSEQPNPGPGPSKEERLAKALRENLKRRKAAPAPPATPSRNQD